MRRTVYLAVLLLAGLEARSAFAEVELGRFVALGDSLTAGFAAGCLRRETQLGGYARWIAVQAHGAGVTFEQPLMTSPGIPAVIELRDSPRLTLAPRSGLGSPINLTLPRPYDNLAVPGAKAGDALRTVSDRGGLHDLVLRGIGTQLEQALLLEPTFASLWIGTTDAFGAAISGIVLDGVTLTPTDRFSADFNALVQALVAGGVGAGVVATIPRIDDLPFVNTLTPVVVDVVTGSPLEIDGSSVPLMGPDGPLVEGDFVLLTASPLLVHGDGIPVVLGGSGLPLPDDVVLSRGEAKQINDRIEDYNRVIRRAAADVGFAVVEVAALFEEWSRMGVAIGGERFTTRYLTGGLFSVDGVHPTPLGHALLANAFIEAINRVYGTSIAQLNLAKGSFEGGHRRIAGDQPARFVFTRRAYKNLRFGLGLSRSQRLLRLKAKALRRSREREERHRRQRYELPGEPALAVRQSREAVPA